MSKWKQAIVGIDQLEETQVNANKMSDAAFNRLVENIRISGGLSSAIGCYRRKEDGKFVIFSGNHRKRAAEQLRILEVPVIYADEEELTNDEIIALQLSHNSLHGDDDKSILARLFAEIKQVDFKEFANITIDEVKPIDTKGVSFSVDSEHYTVSLIFYRKDYELLQELLGVIGDATQKSDLVVLADSDQNEDEYWHLSKEVRDKYNILSTNTTFAKILELAKKQMDSE